MSEWRELRVYERALLERILAEEPDGEALRSEIPRLRAKVLVPEYGSIALSVPELQGQKLRMLKIRAEAEAKDIDGSTISALVFATDHLHLRELQIYKPDGSPIQSMPAPEFFEVEVL